MNAPPAAELQALECDACRVRVPVGGTSTAAARVTSAHVGKPHEGCPGKRGTWRGHYQLSLFDVSQSVGHG